MPLLPILERVIASAFRDVAGARVTADVPISDVLVNDILRDALAGSSGPVREASVTVLPGNRADVRVRLARFSFVPVNLTVTIERQPEMPTSPVVILRWTSALPGLSMLAGRATSFLSALPPGIRMDGDLVFLDVRTLLAQRGLDGLMPLLERLRVTTDEGRILLHLVLAVPT
jgi:hypothetical protein